VILFPFITQNNTITDVENRNKNIFPRNKYFGGDDKLGNRRSEHAKVQRVAGGS
jgi:hypothetical protein